MNCPGASGLYLESIPHYEECIRIEPTMSDAYINYGATEYNLKNYETAGKLYMQAIKLENKKRPNAPARVGLGQVMAVSGHDADAVRLYRESIKFDPKNAEAYRLLAVLLAAHGDFKHAEEVIAKGVEADPEWSDIRNTQGTIFAQQGKLEQAAEAFAQAVRLDPKSEQARDNLERALASLRQPPATR